MKMMQRVSGVILATGVAAMSSACLFSTSSDPIGGTNGGCHSDSDCSTPSAPCRENSCVAGTCIEVNVPEGLPSRRSETDLVCRRLICDGKGNEQSVVDTTAVKDTPNDCKQTSCDAKGDPVMTPNESDLPVDAPGDCKKPACAANGTPSTAPSPNDVAADQPGDCRKPACTTDGLASFTNDDKDPPAPSICMSYTCANGTAKGNPINVGQNCSNYGFSCGATGACDTCPAPNASCTDPGPGKNSRTPNTAYDFGDIGRCDDGGRSFCGVLAAGQTAYFKFRDDGTGLFCQHDPRVAVSPTAEVTLCVGSQCTTTGSMSFATTEGSESIISVTAKTGCTGYQLGFHL